jgi:hypothetical protein
MLMMCVVEASIPVFPDGIAHHAVKPVLSIVYSFRYAEGYSQALTTSKLHLFSKAALFHLRQADG